MILPQVVEREFGDRVLFEAGNFGFPEGFVDNPVKYMRSLVEARTASLVHNSDRSLVYRTELALGRDGSSVIVKRSKAGTKSVAMGRMSSEEASQSLVRRVRNEIYTPRKIAERGVGTGAELFRGAILDGEEAWLIYESLEGKGVFLDDYIAALRGLKDENIKMSILGKALATYFSKLHGKKREEGWLHRDANTGNVFLRKRLEGEDPSPMIEIEDVLFIDWELSDHSEGPRVLERKERLQDIYTLAGETRNINNAGKLAKPEFLSLRDQYLSLIG